MDDQRKNSENQTEDERATLSVPPPSFRERMLAARRAQEREARRPAATEPAEGKEFENASETLPVPPPNLKERIRAARRARQIEVKPSTNIPVPPREAVPDRPPDSSE